MLPHKPSDLIELALADLIKCERSIKYHIDMSVWHEPNGTCAVCLAGAVMAKSLGVSITADAAPHVDIPNADAGKLSALDQFRMGDCEMAFLELGGSEDFGKRFNREITPYEDDAGGFKREMRKLARDLRAARR